MAHFAGRSCTSLLDECTKLNNKNVLEKPKLHILIGVLWIGLCRFGDSKAIQNHNIGRRESVFHMLYRKAKKTLEATEKACHLHNKRGENQL